jgi:adenylate kinase
MNPVTQTQYRAVLLFGAPGSGKGTVGKALGAIPGFVHVACGDLFRMLDTQTALGRAFMEYSSKGLLVPDEITVAMWKDSIDSMIAAHAFVPDRDTLVLDGIPRNVAQAKELEPFLTVIRILHLVCSDENLMFERIRRRALKENRLDDASEEVIRRRWEVYDSETRPVLEHYSKKIVTQVEASGSPLQVIHTILGYMIYDSAQTRI